ncbi:ATP-grasp domain-containing protein [Brevibacillus sp. NPDC058079]|uniref:ATP-grasp domain-containing protein n=1 Tax=Brevibacillus sp. NPDC058079 TaxID=3346330 RepID=UPI0036E6E66D
MAQHRIYFNRCFTTTSKLIEQMKNNPNKDTFNIIISHSQPNHYLQRHTEHYEIEPTCSEDEYLHYIMHNCMKHDIEMFIPRHRATRLAEDAKGLHKIGVKPMFVATPEIYQLLDNKVKTYEDLALTGIVAIPDAHVVRTIDDFKHAYESILSKGSKACLKPISGIGGEGFKRILEMNETEEAFLSSSTALSKTRLERVLQTEGSVSPFMMSEFMEDEEYSIDCLAKDGELLVAIPRRKVDHYRQNIEYREELIEIAEKITKRYKLSFLFNIQTKYHKGLPYLVEINTRFSGGMYKSGATGANMLYWAIQLLKGEDPQIPNLYWNVQAYDSLEFNMTPI